MMHGVYNVKLYPLLLSDFNGTWNFLHKFTKNIHILKFMKVCPVEVELFHGACESGSKDRQADMRKLTVDFRTFANEPKKKPTKCSFPFYESYGKNPLRICTI